MARSGGDQNPPESPWEWNKQTANVMARWLFAACVLSWAEVSLSEYYHLLVAQKQMSTRSLAFLRHILGANSSLICEQTKHFNWSPDKLSPGVTAIALTKGRNMGGKNGWNSQGIKWDWHKCMHRQKHAFLCMHTGTGPSSALTYKVCACTCRDLVSWARTSTRDWQCLVASLAETEGLAWREWMNPLA